MTTSGSLEQLDFTCADTTQTGSKRKAQAIFSRLSDSSGYIYITVNVTDSGTCHTGISIVKYFST
jgi:hypothetical protein